MGGVSGIDAEIIREPPPEVLKMGSATIYDMVKIRECRFKSS